MSNSIEQMLHEVVLQIGLILFQKYKGYLEEKFSREIEKPLVKFPTPGDHYDPLGEHSREERS